MEFFVQIEKRDVAIKCCKKKGYFGDRKEKAAFFLFKII